MRMNFLVMFFVCLLLLLSCRSENKKLVSQQPSREEQINSNLDSLRKTASNGDLIVRLGDDVLSYQIRFINETDQSYSHAGIIVVKDNQKMVAHIAPDDSSKDLIHYIPLDSFITPSRNLECALYRYNFSADERQLFLRTIDSFQKATIHFDRKYDLITNDKMYCSEMISKALAIATKKRIFCRSIPVPKRILPLLINYFKGQIPKEDIVTRQIMTIDNLYHNIDCKQIIKFTLKYLPGE